MHHEVDISHIQKGAKLKFRNQNSFHYILFFIICMFILIFSSCEPEIEKKITVTYHDTGATEGYPPYDSNEYSTGDYLSVKSNEGNLAKTDYSLQGWRDIDTRQDYNYGSQIIAGVRDIHFYPVWVELPDCMVSFNSNQGSAIEPRQVKQGSLLDAPSAPTRSGYIFSGWFEDSVFNQPYDFQKAVTRDMTLHAKWTEIILPVFTITFETDGGSAVEPLQVIQGEKITQIDCDKEGYSLIGWYRDNTYSTEWNFSSDIVEESITLYAKWNSPIVVYQVVYNSNGGSSIQTVQVEENQRLSQPTNPSKDGFAFAGWFKDTLLAIPWDFQEDEVDNNLTLYAKWNQNAVYQVIFNSNGGSSVQTVQIETNQLLSQPVSPDKTGYIFAGWFKDTLLAIPWDFQQNVVSSNLTLYAKWNAAEYEVQFNTVGGSFVSKIKKLHGEPIGTLPVPEKEGYIFTGWFENESYSGQAILPEFEVTANITLSAKWIEGEIDPILRFTLRADDTFEVFADASHDTQSLIIPAFYEGKPVTAISKHGFEGFPFLENVQLPNSIIAIGDYAFSNCRNLITINTPAELQYLGMGAFSTCSSLTSFNLPDSLTIIADSLFGGCTQLTEITIPLGVKYIGNGAFSQCPISSLVIPDSVVTIGLQAFFNTSITLTELTLGSGLKEIGDYAFYNNQITNLVIPDSVISIGDYAFYDCTSLKNLTLGNSVQTIGSGAFYNCTSLTSLTLGKSVQTIGSVAFSGSKLTSLVIPNSVTSIESAAFSGCTSLTNLTLGNSVQSIGSYAFNGIRDTSFTIPINVTVIGEDAFYSSVQKTIRCKINKKPSGWDDDWYGNSYATIVWGY